MTNPSIFGGAITGKGFVINWTALLNQKYTVQWLNKIGDTHWTTLTNVTSTLPVMTVIDEDAPANTNRFYRIIFSP